MFRYNYSHNNTNKILEMYDICSWNILKVSGILFDFSFNPEGKSYTPTLALITPLYWWQTSILAILIPNTCTID